MLIGTKKSPKSNKELCNEAQTMEGLDSCSQEKRKKKTLVDGVEKRGLQQDEREEKGVTVKKREETSPLFK